MPKILLVAALFKLPYRALRCLSATGASVYVLGGRGAGGLRHSRYCKEFFDCRSRIDGRPDLELAREIDHLANALSIDLVVAGDAPSTRSLVGISDNLEAPCFPMPDLATFDLLNNKWKFTRLCKELNITVPRSRVYDDRNQLISDLRRGTLELPLIAKPLSQDSGAGCIRVRDARQARRLSTITYSPIIVQDYILGSDIGASAFCRDGEIEAFLTHHYVNGVYTAYNHPEVYDAISKIAWRLRLSGIFNFDMRLTEDGEIFFLECNPRVYFKIAMSMLAGINFLELGFPWRSEAERTCFPNPVVVQFPKAILRALAAPWKFDKSSWRAPRFLLDDPLPFVRESLGLERGR